MGYLPFLLSMVKLVAVIAVFVSVAFYTLLERKLLGYAQIRKGAGKPSVAGILVPFADAVKLLFKQSTSVSASSTLYWIRGGSILLVPVLLWLWWPMPSSSGSARFLVVVILALFSAQVFGRFGRDEVVGPSIGLWEDFEQLLRRSPTKLCLVLCSLFMPLSLGFSLVRSPSILWFGV